MANSRYYSATDEDVRPWVPTEVTRTSDADEASQAVADALQTAARDSNTVTSISTLPATKTLDLSSEPTVQLVTTPTPAVGAIYTYVSSDPTKATVSSTGLITALATGSTTVTVKCVHDDTITDTCVVTVQA